MKKIIRLRTTFQVSFVLLVFLRLHRTVHPVLVVLSPLAFIAGNFFCGWFCPLGAFQDALSKVGSLFIKKKIKIPPSVQRYAQYSKYLLALVLLILIGAGIMGTEEANSLPVDAYQSFFAIFDGNPLMISAIVFLVFVLILSLFVNRPFCNYLCVNSVEYAVPSWTRIFTIRRKAATCISCKACDQICPMNIQVSTAGELRNLQCINCFRCVARCPVNGTLSYGRADAVLRKLKDGVQSCNRI
jgi:polyferredoxin